MSNLEQNTNIVNEPRKEITDADLAVGLAEFNFHVYLDDTDRQLTSEEIHDYLDDYGQLKDGHTFTVPMMEIAQYRALEALCEKLDDLSNDVRGDLGISLEDIAVGLWTKNESGFWWRSEQSQWENIRRSLLSGKTEFVHRFLNEFTPFYIRAADLHEDLDNYEAAYLKKADKLNDNDKTFSYKDVLESFSMDPQVEVEANIIAKMRKIGASEKQINSILSIDREQLSEDEDDESDSEDFEP